MPATRDDQRYVAVCVYARGMINFALHRSVSHVSSWPWAEIVSTVGVGAIASARAAGFCDWDGAPR